MGSTFNPQILVEKLAKLNNSQQSIETLSHWCIFHMNKAKLVVETWERQFHSSPREMRLAFLYLANDILQNSRRKGAEFVAEFWRVLPEALRDVIRNGDDSGKNAARRLINIWDERKVFGSRGNILKEEFMGRQPENNKSGKPVGVKARQSGSDMVDKIVSDYEAIYSGQSDEDVLISRCSNAVSGLEKVVKDVGNRVNAGKLNGSGLIEELQGKHTTLRECIEQLTSLETSRAILVSHLREALQEQELKLDQLRSQLQAAQLQSEQAANLGQQFVSSETRHNQSQKEAHNNPSSTTPPGFPTRDQTQSSSSHVVYKRQPASLSDEDSRKSTAASVAAQLTASTASAEMLSHVLTSFVSGAIIDNHQPSEKRPKLEDGNSQYTPSPPPPPPPPVESLLPPPPPPPPSSSPPHMLPPMPPYHPMFLQSVGPMSNVAYTYGATHNPTGPPFVAPTVNPYQNYQASEGVFYNPSSSISHQQSL